MINCLSLLFWISLSTVNGIQSNDTQKQQDEADDNSTIWNELPFVPMPSGYNFTQTVEMVFSTDRKIHVFYSIGADQGTSPNWHPSIRFGSWHRTFDLSLGNWTQSTEYGAFDTDLSHREHVFGVGRHVLAFVYSIKGTYSKFFEFVDGQWHHVPEFDVPGNSTDLLKITGQDETTLPDLRIKFFDTADGFYMIRETIEVAHVIRFKVELDANGAIQNATRSSLSRELPMSLVGQTGPHMTNLAYSSDYNTLFLWGGEEGCGFWWDADWIYVYNKTYDTESSSAADFRKLPLQPPTPPYIYAGPHATVQMDNKLIMLGGSENKAIWWFDLNNMRYNTSDRLQLPKKLEVYRVSATIDRSNGNVYVIDPVKGFFMSNFKTLLP